MAKDLVSWRRLLLTILSIKVRGMLCVALAPSLFGPCYFCTTAPNKPFLDLKVTGNEGFRFLPISVVSFLTNTVSHTNIDYLLAQYVGFVQDMVLKLFRCPKSRGLTRSVELFDGSKEHLPQGFGLLQRGKLTEGPRSICPGPVGSEGRGK